MKEEDEVLKMQSECKRPFKVPDGYFESLNSRIMERLPERQEKRFSIRMSLSRNYRYVVAIAAAVCFAICGSVVYVEKLSDKSASQEHNLSATNATYSDGTLEDMAEYAMMDNDDMYVLISDY